MNHEVALDHADAVGQAIARNLKFSVRDFFAGCALIGLLHPERFHEGGDKALAQRAFAIADQMMQASLRRVAVPQNEE